MLAAAARYGFGRLLLGQLRFADGAGFSHHVSHDLYSLAESLDGVADSMSNTLVRYGTHYGELSYQPRVRSVWSKMLTSDRTLDQSRLTAATN